MMRWTRLSIITIVSFLIVASGAFFKKSIALSLCSILAFNSVTCHAYFENTNLANAALPPSNNDVEQSLTSISEGQEVAGVCLFGICVPVDLPAPIENAIEGELNKAAERQLRSLFADEIPIQGNDHEFYDSVADLPGGAFTPQPLPLSAISSDTPIPAGDYEIPAHFYCTKIYSFDGRGNRFPLARLSGHMSDVLSALYARVSYDTSVSTNDIQMLSWAIQTGISYNELSDSQQALIDRLIPDYRDRMESSLVDRLTELVNNVSHISGNRLPGVNQILDDLGPVGDVAGSLLKGREQILRTNYDHQALAQEFAPQQDAVLNGGTEETSWSRVQETVYMRFIAPDGAMDDGTVQVRIVDNYSSQLNPENQSIIVASLPPNGEIPSNTTSRITAGSLTQNITQSVGVPEAGGAQAITASLPPSQEFDQTPCPDVEDFQIMEHPYLDPSYDPSSKAEPVKNHRRYGDRYHHYTTETTICSTSNLMCTRERVFKEMLSRRRFMAPAKENQDSPVEHCRVTDLQGPGIRGLLGSIRYSDHIINIVDQPNFTAINYTFDPAGRGNSHIFHPGRVIRTIIERDRNIIVKTEGEGTGQMPRINETEGSALFKSIDQQLKIYIESLMR